MTTARLASRKQKALIVQVLSRSRNGGQCHPANNSQPTERKQNALRNHFLDTRPRGDIHWHFINQTTIVVTYKSAEDLLTEAELGHTKWGARIIHAERIGFAITAYLEFAPPGEFRDALRCRDFEIAAQTLIDHHRTTGQAFLPDDLPSSLAKPAVVSATIDPRDLEEPQFRNGLILAGAYIGIIVISQLLIWWTK